MSSFRRKVKVKRRSAGSYVNGLYEMGEESEMEIYASVQPVSADSKAGERLQSMAEGRRSSSSYILYTDTELNTVESSNPDIVVLFNENYEIIQVEKWQSGVINHYKCYAVRINGS